MITIVAKVILKEGKKADFIAVVQDMIAGSRAEAGNISYDLYEDTDNENILSFIEKWESLDAIDLHNNSEHFKKGIEGITPLMESIEINKYQVL